MYNKHYSTKYNLYDLKKYDMWLNKKIVFCIPDIRFKMSHNIIEDYEAKEELTSITSNRIYNKRSFDLISCLSDSVLFGTSDYNHCIEKAKLQYSINNLNGFIRYNSEWIEKYIVEIYENIKTIDFI